MTAREADIKALAQTLRLEVKATFVPFTQSRSKHDSQPSLNWKVCLYRHGKLLLATDYTAGCAHCPSYREPMTQDAWKAVTRECQHGTRSLKPILPKTADVLASLASDATAIDYASFEEWADEHGFDSDRRKAYETYQACLTIGIKLRAALGDEGLKKLQEATREY